MRLNLFTFIFLILAIGSSLISIYVFDQGLIGIVLAVLLLVIAAYTTKFNQPEEQKRE